MDVKMGHADMNIGESSMRPFEVESTLSNVSQLQLQSKVKGKPTPETQIITCENPIHRPICIIQHPFDTLFYCPKTLERHYATTRNSAR